MRVAVDTNRLTDLFRGDAALADLLEGCDEVNRSFDNGITGVERPLNVRIPAIFGPRNAQGWLFPVRRRVRITASR